jgi:hypothetical protein
MPFGVVSSMVGLMMPSMASARTPLAFVLAGGAALDEG